MAKLPISCFIIAKNEADRIATTINSVKGWVDEVIVIDSGSADNTVSVAESLGARVIYHAWPGYGLQKRFGEEQCKNQWFLNLDADEEITPELAAEIQKRFAAGLPGEAGYFLLVRDLLPGEKKLAPFAHTNTCLRLYDKTKGRFSESPVHDSVLMPEGKTDILFGGPVLHRSFRSIKHMLEKMDWMTSQQAADLATKGLPFAHLRLIFEFPAAFLKAYFSRMYCLRGWRGIVYSALYAYGRFTRIAKYVSRKKN